MKARLMGWIALSAAVFACAREEPDRTRALATESAAGAAAPAEAAPAEAAPAEAAPARADTSATGMAGMRMAPDSTGAAHGEAMPGMPGMRPPAARTTGQRAPDHSRMPGMGAMPGMGSMGGMGGAARAEGAARTGRGMPRMPAMEHGGMRGAAPTRAMPGMPGMPGMEAPRDPGREKLDRLVALLLRDPVVLQRIEADTLLHARWNDVARRTLSSPE